MNAPIPPLPSAPAPAPRSTRPAPSSAVVASWLLLAGGALLVLERAMLERSFGSWAEVLQGAIAFLVAGAATYGLRTRQMWAWWTACGGALYFGWNALWGAVAWAVLAFAAPLTSGVARTGSHLPGTGALGVAVVLSLARFGLLLGAVILLTSEPNRQAYGIGFPPDSDA